MSRVNAMSWTVDDAQAWLLQQGPSVAISEVMESFKQNEVDGATLLELTSSDLQDELRIKSLGVRKALLKSVHQLQYLERSRHLKNAITVQLEISTEDLALDKEVLKAQSCDFTEAARIWQEDLIQIRQVMEDAEFSNQVQSVELGMQRHSHANMEVARELQAHVDHLCELERYDAQVATAVDAARTEDQVQQALARADVPPEAPQVVAEQPEAEPPQAEPAQAGQSEPQAQPPQAEPAQASRKQQEPPKPTKLPADQGSVAAASASAASSSSYEPGAAASSSTQLMSVKKTKCHSCFEMKSNVTKLRCEHAMCNGCLAKLLLSATTDLTLWPPRCCRQPIDLSVVKRVLSPQEELLFAERLEEAQAEKKMYCVNPYCSHFLNLDIIGTDKMDYACPKCATSLCLTCQRGAHPNATCEEAKQRRGETADEQQFQELAGREGWRRCGHCGVMVQLSSGCNHMTCRCSHHFCYACGSKWEENGERLCNCDLWVEANLIQEEERQVQIFEQVHRRPVREPERQQIRERLEAGECQHRNWRKQDFGFHGLNQKCSNCGFRMCHYCYQCGRCKDMVCHTCVLHRL